jgi:hypothetical protein
MRLNGILRSWSISYSKIGSGDTRCLFPDVSRHQNVIIFKAWKVILGVCEPWKWHHYSVSKIQKKRRTVTQYVSVCVCVCVCHAQIHNGLTYVTLTINLDSYQGLEVSLTLWRICCRRKFLFWSSERRLGDTQRESQFGGKRKNLSLCRGSNFDHSTSNQSPSMLLRPMYTQFTYPQPAVQLRTHLYCVTRRTAVSEKMPTCHGVRSVRGWECFMLGPGLHIKTYILLADCKICMPTHVLISYSLETGPNT